MLAAVFTQAGAPLEVRRIRRPEPSSGEVLVRVAGCGVCHSDLHYIKGETTTRMPCVLGHEISGIVAELGDGVDDIAVGDAIVTGFIMPCGTCERCAEGREDFCEKFWRLNRQQGVLYDGQTRLFELDGSPIWMSAMSGFAEYSVVPALAVCRAPTTIALEAAATIGCSVYTAYGAVRRSADVQRGDSIAVFGVGGVGTSIVQVARAFGANPIIAIDVTDAKLADARRIGATHVVNAAREEVVERVRELTAGRGVDAAFEAIGDGSAFQQCLGVVARGGRVVLSGVTKMGDQAPLEMNALVRNALTVIGSYGARTRADLPTIVELIELGRIRSDLAVTQVFALDAVNDAFSAMDRREILGRAVVQMPARG